MNISKRDVLRYLGCRDEDRAQGLYDAIDRLQKEVLDVATPRVLKIELDRADIPWSGETVNRALSNCNKAVLFAATLGAGVDRLLLLKESVNMGDAVIVQAIAAAMIECVCNELQSGYNARPRVSPGYGDFPISAQREILKILDAPKKIGLSATDALMLVPTKSVTAIFGIKENACD